MKKIFLMTSLCLAVFVIAGCGGGDRESVSEKTLNGKSAMDKAKEVAKEAEEKVNKKVPNNLIQCSDEIFSSMSNCFDLEDDWVCGYDHTIYDNGKEQDHGLDYRTPCHYCNFFGEDLEKKMMGTKAKALGYSKGKCD